MILIEKWDSFCVETKRLGTEKMSQAKSEAEKIIQSGHSHSHKVKRTSRPLVDWSVTDRPWHDTFDAWTFMMTSFLSKES